MLNRASDVLQTGEHRHTMPSPSAQHQMFKLVEIDGKLEEVVEMLGGRGITAC
jgi:hypothetical protein